MATVSRLPTLLFAPYTPPVLRFLRFAFSLNLPIQCAVPPDVSERTLFLIKAFGGDPITIPRGPWKIDNTQWASVDEPRSIMQQVIQIHQNHLELKRIIRQSLGVIWWTARTKDWKNDSDWALKLGNAKTVPFDFCTRDDFAWYIEGLGMGPVIQVLKEIHKERPNYSSNILVCSLRKPGEEMPKRSVNLFTSFGWRKWTHLQGAFSLDPVLTRPRRDPRPVVPHISQSGTNLAPLDPPPGGSIEIDLFLRAMLELVITRFATLHDVDLNEMPLPQMPSPRDIHTTLLNFFRNYRGGFRWRNRNLYGNPLERDDPLKTALANFTPPRVRQEPIFQPRTMTHVAKPQRLRTVHDETFPTDPNPTPQQPEQNTALETATEENDKKIKRRKVYFNLASLSDVDVTRPRDPPSYARPGLRLPSTYWEAFRKERDLAALLRMEGAVERR